MTNIRRLTDLKRSGDKIALGPSRDRALFLLYGSRYTIIRSVNLLPIISMYGFLERYNVDCPDYTASEGRYRYPTKVQSRLKRINHE